MSSQLSAIGTKLFILDTNVLMHDPMSLYRFGDNDVFVPVIVLEELDDHKQGQSGIARSTRQAMRLLSQVLDGAKAPGVSLDQGIPLSGPSNGLASGRLFLQTKDISLELPEGFARGKNDNQILAVALYLQRNFSGRTVILVTKDINVQIKADALGIVVQDYFNDKVLQAADRRYTGVSELPENFWDQHPEMVHLSGGRDACYQFNSLPDEDFSYNQCVFQNTGGGDSFQAIVTAVSGDRVTLRRAVNYQCPKNAVFGLTARNIGQNFALNLLMDQNIDFVTILGRAGTGKTVLSLAAALQQVVEDRSHRKIIFTRLTMPLGEGIGWLPGTKEEKMAPWMRPVFDNLGVLGARRPEKPIIKPNGSYKQTDIDPDEARAASIEYLLRYIEIEAVDFMRGASLSQVILIIDEAQNLTPHQVKSLVTRAGEGTRVILLGDTSQIDSPYLDEGSSGLTYAVERFREWEGSGHILLQDGERSRLATYAASVL